MQVFSVLMEVAELLMWLVLSFQGSLGMVAREDQAQKWQIEGKVNFFLPMCVGGQLYPWRAEGLVILSPPLQRVTTYLEKKGLSPAFSDSDFHQS